MARNVGGAYGATHLLREAFGMATKAGGKDSIGMPAGTGKNLTSRVN